jgi:hypothetical protein
MDKKRRNFLKILIIGGGVFIGGKIIGPRVLEYFSAPPIVAEKDFGNFKVSDDKKELIISDSQGEEILIIDK